MRKSLTTAFAIALATFWIAPLPSRATIGLAEWSLQTPGTNIVCHSDPYKESHGTCLRPSDDQLAKNPGVTVYVSQIEWWQYFPGRIVGKAAKGFFIFDENPKSVAYHITEPDLRARLTQLSAGKPTTRPLTPKDGWALNWGPLLKSAYEENKKTDTYKKMSPAQKQQLEEQMKEFSSIDIKPTEP